MIMLPTNCRAHITQDIATHRCLSCTPLVTHRTAMEEAAATAVAAMAGAAAAPLRRGAARPARPAAGAGVCVCWAAKG